MFNVSTLSNNTHFSLFGVNYTGLNNEFLQYKGSVDPDELPKILKTGFGLVWDGSSLFSCDGNSGEYLKWNNPHKFSLYMASGIPVFVWVESALASFVIDHNLGFTINSLNEIEDILKNLTIEEYETLLNTKIELYKEIMTGDYVDSYLFLLRCWYNEFIMKDTFLTNYSSVLKLNSKYFLLAR